MPRAIIDGASFEDVGLKWPGKEIVSANKDDTIVTITGTNNTKKGQRFSSIHLSFPVGPEAETALYTSTKFAKMGGMTVGDVVFDIVADEGVTGVGKNITSRYKSEDRCIKIQILLAPGCDAITLPPQKAIKFVFTGKTGEVGISSCLVREEWYPPTPDGKKFYDVMVEKQ